MQCTVLAPRGRMEGWGNILTAHGWVRVWLQDETSSTCLQPVRWNAHEQYIAGTPGRIIVWYVLGANNFIFQFQIVVPSSLSGFTCLVRNKYDLSYHQGTKESDISGYSF